MDNVPYFECGDGLWEHKYARMYQIRDFQLCQIYLSNAL